MQNAQLAALLSLLVLTACRPNITNASITGYQLAINQQGGAVTLRGTTIAQFTQAGIYLTGGTLDLGNATTAGNNTLTPPVTDFTHFGLFDNRGATGPANTSGKTSFDGVVPAPMTSATGPIQVAGQYSIATPGNQIALY
jgi:hypothetical protein